VSDAPKSYPQLRFQPPPGATRLLVIRHGQSAPAEPDKPFALVDGHGDPELSPEGRQQAEALADRLAGEPITAIYVSKLRRTAETAAPLAAELAVDPAVDPDIHEVHLGDWEGGLLRQMAAEGHPDYLRMHAEERWDTIPGGEPSDTFRGRVWAGFERIVAAHPDELVAVVVHGGVIGAFLSQVTSARPFAFNGADNASISYVVHTPERWILRSFNDTGHLRSHFEVEPERPT
jgi:2,3-bisphosphoglycerate-dependent phosphoglycerate mutase